MSARSRVLQIVSERIRDPVSRSHESYEASELAAGQLFRRLGRLPLFHPIAGRRPQMRPDFFVQILLTAPSPLHSSPPPAEFMTPVMAFTSSVQRVYSETSCFLPAAVDCTPSASSPI